MFEKIENPTIIEIVSAKVAGFMVRNGEVVSATDLSDGDLLMANSESTRDIFKCVEVKEPHITYIYEMTPEEFYNRERDFIIVELFHTEGVDSIQGSIVDSVNRHEFVREKTPFAFCMVSKDRKFLKISNYDFKDGKILNPKFDFKSI